MDSCGRRRMDERRRRRADLMVAGASRTSRSSHTGGVAGGTCRFLRDERRLNWCAALPCRGWPVDVVPRRARRDRGRGARDGAWGRRHWWGSVVGAGAGAKVNVARGGAGRCTPDALPANCLHFTASLGSHRRMRRIARRMYAAATTAARLRVPARTPRIVR